MDNIKVQQNDSRRRMVDVKNIEPVSNIKIIRGSPSVSSESNSFSDDTDISDEPVVVKKKKTKTVLRKKMYSEQPTNRNYSAFSNPQKVKQRYNESEYSSDPESEYSENYSDDQNGDDKANDEMSWEEKQKMKQDLLIKIQALEKKGFEFSKKFNMTSSYDEMEFEYTKVQKFIETQGGVKFARRCLMACVTGIEFLNKRFDPFNIKLEGWSENVMESIDDYDNIFEKLHEKYSSKSQIAPEIELLLTLGGSAFMFHLTNSLLKSPMMESMGPIAQNNPNFMANMMGAMSQGMKEMNKPPNFKPQQPQQQQQPAQQPFPQPMETRGIRKEMRGPSLDPNLFNGTPLATNYPQPPPPMYYEQNPIEEDDRFSVASSDSSLSSISVQSHVKSFKINQNRNRKNTKSGGLELNIN
jgi:hypothetical protein